MHSHLVRYPIPVDHDMPFAKDGACTTENITRAFPDPYEKLLASILIVASLDNEEKKVVWAGVNAAYVDRLAGKWWALQIGTSWFWFVTVFTFPFGFVRWKIEKAATHFIEQKLVDEVIEWDYIEPETVDGEPIGYESNLNMPVYYPTPAFVDRLNDALI